MNQSKRGCYRDDPDYVVTFIALTFLFDDVKPKRRTQVLERLAALATYPGRAPEVSTAGASDIATVERARECIRVALRRVCEVKGWETPQWLCGA
jgi:hypothetical protein